MKNLNCAVTGVILLAASGLALAEDYNQSTDTMMDTREAIKLPPEGRAAILAEMRLFLSGVQAITEALSKDDLQAVVAAAKSLGMQSASEVSPELKAMLPKSFKQLGFKVHGEFDQMAADVANGGNGKQVLSQLGGTLKKCVACHNAYQLPQ